MLVTTGGSAGDMAFDQDMRTLPFVTQDVPKIVGGPCLVVWNGSVRARITSGESFSIERKTGCLGPYQ